MQHASKQQDPEGAMPISKPLVVLLVPDPGLPERRTTAVQSKLQQSLESALDRDVVVYVRADAIPIDREGTLNFRGARRIAGEYESVDATVIITEVPRHTRGRPHVAEVHPEHHTALVSCPTLGPIPNKRRLANTLADCVLRACQQPEAAELPSRGGRWARWSWSDAHGTWQLHARRAVGGLRTVLGMVAGNEPLKIAPQLSTALTVAAATGAFGIFYNSIWQMSAALSAVRMVVIAALAISAMVVWLVVGNRLWERPRRQSQASVMILYNASTVLTLAFCMIVLYFSLAGIILIAAVIVIDPGFMSEILGFDATFRNYLDVAWLSAALGAVAGALGSSFDSDTDVKQLTHGQRERQRTLAEDD